MKTLYHLLRRVMQPMYRIRGIGLGRLCEMIRRHIARHAPANPLVIDDFLGRAKFYCYLREHMSGQIFSKAAIAAISSL